MNLLNPSTGRFIDILQLNAQHFPTRSALSLNFSETHYKYKTLNWSQYLLIIQKVSVQLLKSLQIEPNNSKNCERVSIGILSNSSSEYIFYTLAFMMLNIVPVHLSTRISDDSKLALLEEAKACGIICSEEFIQSGISVQYKASYPIELLKLNKLNYLSMLTSTLSPSDQAILQPFTNLSNQGDQLAYFVHSTGSTNLTPKLIPLKNSCLLAQTSRALSDNPSYPKLESCVPLLPLFHTGGQLFQLWRPIRWAQHVISGPNFNDKILEGSIVLDMLKHVQFNYIIWLPKLLIELIDYCDSIPYNQGWELIQNWGGINQVGGAPLPLEYSNKFLKNGLKLQNVFGSSEVGIFGYSNIVQNLIQDQYLFIDKQLKYYWNSSEVDGDGEESFELVINREELGLFNRSEDYYTKDLFKVIEWSPRLACSFQSRSDDVLIHITGEKTNPLPIELKLNECNLIQRSVILGRNHTLNQCLIQLNWEEVQKIGMEQAKQEIFNQLKLVNEFSPSHSRLLPSCTHFLSQREEITISVKGNVLRQFNFKKFEYLINNNQNQQFDLPHSPIEEKSTIELIQDIVTDALNLPKLIDIQHDFFKSGLDSLSALIILKKLKTYFPNIKLNVNQIYKLKSCMKLAEYFDNNGRIQNEDGIESIQSIQDRVDSLISKYTSKFDEYGPVTNKFKTSGRVVLVVGSNGSLACHYIHSLLNRSDVTKVIGLVRGNSFSDKTNYQISIMKEKGLTLKDRSLKKLKCFSSNLLTYNFNLPNQLIQELLNNVTEVIQIGWRMNFLNELEDFEDCIETTSNLLEFCLFNRGHPKLFQFVSTIAPTVHTYKEEYMGLIPELPTPGRLTNLTNCTGYGLSKLVSEQICYSIAKSKSLPVKVYRVGELSGDQLQGQWNIKEFLPLLIRQIVKLRAFPDLSSKLINWVPIDLAGGSLAELGVTQQQEEAGLFTIVNPKPTEWNVIIDYIQFHLNVKLQKVNLNQFLELIKTSSSSSSSNSEQLDISEGLEDFLKDYLQDDGSDVKIVWDTKKTCKFSDTLSKCDEIGIDLISKYFNYWVKIGYFN